MSLQSLTASTSTAFPFVISSSPSFGSSYASAMEGVNRQSSSVLPESHTWPQENRPKVAHNEYVTGLALPVIDLQSQEEEVCRLRKLRNACEQWGFFHVVNHRVPPELLLKMVEISCSFFSLPGEKKLEITTQGSRKFRLYESFTRRKYTRCSWVEGLNVHDMQAIPQIADSVWPERSAEISQAFSDYLEEMRKLGQEILQLLVLSLGVNESSAANILSGCGFTGTRFNFYPSCPDPLKVLGLVPHTDPNCMTILHQDSVGGLQIAKDGQWIAVKPIQNAFVINIGDSFQAWSNCRYMSVEHRVVVNSQSPRISIAYFFGPTGEFMIEPPSELVDEQHPILHRPYTYKEYMSWRTKSDLTGKKSFKIFADPGFVSS